MTESVAADKADNLPITRLVISEIDDICGEIEGIFNTMFDRLSVEYDVVGKDPIKLASSMSLSIGRDYFRGGRAALLAGQLISAGSLARASAENLADLAYIMKNPDKYASKYVDSKKNFKKAMNDAVVQGVDGLNDNRTMKQANKWTNSSVDDRVSGLSIAGLYDLLCYFAHPNPGALIYFDNTKFYEGQLNLVGQLITGSAVFLQGMATLSLGWNDIEGRIDNCAARLGISVFEESVK